MFILNSSRRLTFSTAFSGRDDRACIFQILANFIFNAEHVYYKSFLSSVPKKISWFLFLTVQHSNHVASWNFSEQWNPSQWTCLHSFLSHLHQSVKWFSTVFKLICFKTAPDKLKLYFDLTVQCDGLHKINRFLYQTLINYACTSS